MGRQHKERCRATIGEALSTTTPRYPSLATREQEVFAKLARSVWDSHCEPRWVFVRAATRDIPAIMAQAENDGMEAYFPGVVSSEDGRPVIRHVIPGCMFIRIRETRGDKPAVAALFEWYTASPLYGRFQFGDAREMLVMGDAVVTRFRRGIAGKSIKIGEEGPDYPIFSEGDVVRYIGTQDNELSEWLVEAQEGDEVTVRARRALGGVFQAAGKVKLTAHLLSLLQKRSEGLQDAC